MPPPIDQPAACTRARSAQPSASTSERTSSLQSRRPREASTGNAALRPNERRSGATTRKRSGTRSASALKKRPVVRLPCTSSSGSPSSGPATQQCVRKRAVSTVRVCIGSDSFILRTPNFASRLDDELELAPLIIFAERVAGGDRREAALRAQRQVLQGYDPGRLVDPPPQVIRRFKLR